MFAHCLAIGSSKLRTKSTDALIKFLDLRLS